jgi:hypothetical protein
MSVYRLLVYSQNRGGRLLQNIYQTAQHHIHEECNVHDGLSCWFLEITRLKPITSVLSDALSISLLHFIYTDIAYTANLKIMGSRPDKVNDFLQLTQSFHPH